MLVSTSYEVRPIFTTKTTPDFLSDGMYGLIQIPLYLQLVNASMDMMKWDKVLISVNDPDDHALIDEIIISLRASIYKETDLYWSSTIYIYNQYEVIESN